MVRKVLFALVIKPFVKLFIGVRRVGELKLPKGRFIIVSNHASHIDTLVLMSLIPLSRLDEVRPVAAADYWTKNRLVFSVVSFLFNILPIPRKPSPHNNPLEIMERAVDDGYSLIIYPEGTRDYGESVGPFKSGVAHLIKRKPDLYIIPVYVGNTWKILPKGQFIPVPLFVDVVVGGVMRFRGDEPKEEILKRLYEAVLSLREKTNL